MKPTYSTTAEILSIYRDKTEAHCVKAEQADAIKPQYKTTSQILATFPREIVPYNAGPQDS